jgi:hypothetical protein
VKGFGESRNRQRIFNKISLQQLVSEFNYLAGMQQLFLLPEKGKSELIANDQLNPMY